MDWNPFDGALFTGAGTVAGPMQYGQATYPTQPTPVDYTTMPAFDQTQGSKILMNQLAQAGGQNKANALADASRLGTSQSGGTEGQLNSINADTQNRQAGVQYQAAKDTFDTQMAEKNQADALNQQMYNNQLNKYANDQGNYLAEQARRRDTLGPFGAFLGL